MMERKKKVRSVISVFLALALLCCLCACGEKPQGQGENGGSASGGSSGASAGNGSVPAAGGSSDGGGDGGIPSAPGGSEAPGSMKALGTFGSAFEAVRAQTLVLPAGYEELSEAIIRLRDSALDLLSGDLALQAGYALTMAESYATSVRNACDLILAGRGVTFENVGLFADWNQIKHLSLVSAMPYLMQAVCEAEAGDEAAKEHMAQFERMGETLPAEKALRNLAAAPDAELRGLREALADFECEIYTFYPVIPDDGELTGFENLTSYHLLIAQTYMEMGMYRRALESYEDAVRTDPFDVTLMGETAWCAICAGDSRTALEYLDNGLLYDPSDAGINLLAALYFAGAEDSEAAAGYLRQARASGLTAEQEDVAAKVDAYLEGGN